jgi:hypothetical protein
LGSGEQDEPRIELIEVAVTRPRTVDPRGTEPTSRTRPGGLLTLLGVVGLVALALGVLAWSSRGHESAARPDTRWYLPDAVPAGYQLVSGAPVDSAPGAANGWRRVFGVVDRQGRLTKGIQIDTDSTAGGGELDTVATATALTTPTRTARQLTLDDGRVRVSFVIPDCGAVSLVSIGLSAPELATAVGAARCTTVAGAGRFADTDAPASTTRLFDAALLPTFGARSMLQYERGDGARIDVLVAATIPPGVVAFQGAATLTERNGRRVAEAVADPSVAAGRRAMAADAKRATIVATVSGDAEVDLVTLVANVHAIDSFTWRQKVATASGIVRPPIGFAYPKGVPAVVRAGRVSDDETVTQIGPQTRSTTRTPQIDLSTTRRTAPYAEGYDRYETVGSGDQTFRIVAVPSGGWRVIAGIGNARVVAAARTGTRDEVLDVMRALVVVDESTLSRSGVSALFGGGSAGR